MKVKIGWEKGVTNFQGHRRERHLFLGLTRNFPANKEQGRTRIKGRGNWISKSKHKIKETQNKSNQNSGEQKKDADLHPSMIYIWYKILSFHLLIPNPSRRKGKGKKWEGRRHTGWEGEQIQDTCPSSLCIQNSSVGWRFCSYTILTMITTHARAK